MRELFSDLPKHTRKTFKKHFLKSVHCELGFSSVSTEVILSNESKLRAKLEPLGFKDCKRLHQASFVLNQSDTDMKVANHSVPLGLVFSSTKPKREIQILNDKIVVSDHNYQGFSTFLSSFKEMAFATFDVLNIQKQINKVGFRKINTVVVEEAKSYSEATEIFNPVIFGISKSGLLAPDTLKGLENVTVLEKDKRTFILRAIASKLPQPQTYQSTLDFDLVNQNMTDRDTVFSSLLPEMNDLHFDLFMWAVTEDLIKVMEA